MFANTTAAGGDVGSHNYAAAMARDPLLREHRLTGWIPGNFWNFCGPAVNRGGEPEAADQGTWAPS
jgi:hypothetical protein